MNRAPGILLYALTIFLVGLNAGCSPEPYETALNQVIAREIGGNARTGYPYRCTVGAHRGASVEHRENTLAALQAADRDSRFGFVEFDVQYSGDNRIVVFHDTRLLRLFGSLSSVGGATYAELEELTGGEIAAYEEVMDTVAKKINIEIKSQGDHAEDRRLVDEIIEDLVRRDRKEDVLISSISEEVVRYVGDRYPPVATGLVRWLTPSAYLHIDSLTEGLYEEMAAADADYLMLHVANLRNIDDLLSFKPAGRTIVFWNFDDAMYVVHKDVSDRLWGESAIESFARHLRRRISAYLDGWKSGGAEADS
jgi:glycerophosphoryl diester phosphodiesterase